MLEAGIRDPAIAASMNSRVGVVPVEATLTARRNDAARVEKLRELCVRHLVALEPEVADVHAMPRRLVRARVVAPHPERARLDEHDAVGVYERRRQQRADERDETNGAAARARRRAMHEGIVGMHRSADPL
jgi:hypothetical protein